MSENDVLIEMQRLRTELAEVRREMHPSRRRASSYARPTVAGTAMTGQELRNRVGLAMVAGIALVVMGLAWMLYHLIAATAGGLFDDLVPEPVVRTAGVALRMALAMIG